MFNPRKSLNSSFAGRKSLGRFSAVADKSNFVPGQDFFVSLYNCPPDGEISIEEIENLTSERIKLLRLFEIANMKFAKNTTEWTDFVFKELKDFEKVFAFKFGDDDNYTKMIRNDIVSHYFIRLPYCRTDELRKWLLAHEVDLFKYRFTRLQNDPDGKNVVSKFLSKIDLNLKVVSSGEKKIHEKWLKLCLGSQSSNFDSIEFYKVHFTQALDLVRTKRAFVNSGFLYVPHTDLSSIVITHFRAHLSLELARTSQRLSLMEDERVTPRLVALSNQYLGKKYGQSGGTVSVEQIEQLVTSSFPLCMSSIHFALKETKHAKHWARLQYGLFLKAVGLSSDDALTFWRKYLTKNSDADSFDKKYAYLFRHMYGKEGKKVSYSPYSCIKIQNGSQPGTADEFHGCPYKHNPVNILTTKLDKMGLHKTEINDVMSFVQSKNYCMACTKEFEYRHRISENVFTAITHPNQYYEESNRFTTTGSVSNRMRGVHNTEAVGIDELKQIKEELESQTSSQKSGGSQIIVTEDMMDTGLSQEDLQFLNQSAAEFDEDFE